MTTIVHDPENTEPVDVLYAFLSTDSKGNEGICAGDVGGHLVQLTTALPSNLELMREIAVSIARHTDKQIRLVKFTRAEVLEVITP